MCTFQKVNVHMQDLGDMRRPVKGSTRYGEDLYVWIFPVSSGRRNEVWDLEKLVIVLIKPERNGRMKDYYGQIYNVGRLRY